MCISALWSLDGYVQVAVAVNDAVNPNVNELYVTDRFHLSDRSLR